MVVLVALKKKKKSVLFKVPENYIYIPQFCGFSRIHYIEALYFTSSFYLFSYIQLPEIFSLKNSTSILYTLFIFGNGKQQKKKKKFSFLYSLPLQSLFTMLLPILKFFILCLAYPFSYIICWRYF